MIKARLVEQEFVLHFRIDNPNDVSLPVRGLNYTLYLDSVLLAKGDTSQWFTVPARGRKVFEVPVRTNLWRHVKNVVKMLEKPDSPIPYRLNGEVKTGFFFGRSVHMSRNGEIIPGDFISE